LDVPTLIRKVQRRFGDSNQIFITQTDLIDWINEGQFKLAKETKCLSTSVNAAASTYPIPKPVDCLKIERITPLYYVDLDELDSMGVDITTQSTPLMYYNIGEQINLYPDPLGTDTTNVKLQYSQIPTTIALTTDPLSLPVSFHEDLVTAVLIRAHERNENWKAVEVLSNELQATLSSRLEDTNVPDDTYVIVRDEDIHLGAYGDW